MKTFTFFVSFLFAFAVLQAQNYQISFTGSGQSTTIDNIQVKNLTQGTTLSLEGDDVLHLVGTVGINTVITDESNVKIYPNPMVESTFVEFVNSKTELVSLEIFNEMGILIAKQSTLVQQGRQRFKISGLNVGIYNVNVSAADWKYTSKLISLGKTAGNTAIEHQGTGEGSSPKNAIKSTKDLVEMQYNDGEIILFKGFSGIYTRVLTLLPTQSQTVNFEFISCSDEDGNNYAVVTIGDQIWMAENLKIGIRINGADNQTDNGIIERYCYDDNTSNCDTYGGLYQWAEQVQYLNGASNTTSWNPVPTGNVQGICPNGWHLPTDVEWTTLTDYLGGESVAGGKMKETGTTHWDSPNTGATNSSGFTALPGGGRIGNWYFGDFGYTGSWWSSTEGSGTGAWFRFLYNTNVQLHRTNYIKTNGFSVRCLKD